MLFRQLVAKDIPRLLEIEKQSNPYAWPVEKLISALTQFSSFVVEIEGSVCALMIAQVVGEQADIIHIVRDHQLKGQKIGYKLINNTLGQLRLQGVCSVFLEVRESNQSAISCYDQLGFLAIGLRKNYYHNGEHAISMKKTLGDELKFK